MFPLGDIFGTLTQGGLLGSGAAGESQPAASATGGISGPTTFSKGGVTLNKSDMMPLLIVAGVAALIFVVLRKRK